MKYCKSYEKNETKNIRLLNFQFFINRISILMFFLSIFHVVCKISSFDMWTAKHLVQTFCIEVNLPVNFQNGLPYFREFFCELDFMYSIYNFHCYFHSNLFENKKSNLINYWFTLYVVRSSTYLIWFSKIERSKDLRK